MAELARKSSAARPQLAAVKWSLPSTPPDTSELDADWSDEPAPRYSFIALKPARAKTLPLPPQVAGAALPSAAATGRSVAASAVLAAQLAYDVWDSPRAMLVLVDLPGVDPEHVALTLGSHTLYVEVNVPSSASQPGVVPGHHELNVELPDGLGPDALDASFRDGVLRIRISKAEAGIRHISVASLGE